MKVTTQHPASSFGMPVILADDGSLMDYAPGIKAIRAKADLTTQALAELCGVSLRTVEGWEQSRPPTAAALNVMADLVCPPLLMDSQIGYLTLLSDSGERDKWGKRLYLLRCACGAEIKRTKGDLDHRIKSCGCRQQENIVARAKRANTLQAQGEEHGGADFYWLESPDGTTYKGRNLNQFIRDNSHLFRPEDVVWKDRHCRASVGLNSLNGTKSKSWKGWTKGGAAS